MSQKKDCIPVRMGDIDLKIELNDSFFHEIWKNISKKGRDQLIQTLTTTLPKERGRSFSSQYTENNLDMEYYKEVETDGDGYMQSDFNQEEEQELFIRGRDRYLRVFNLSTVKEEGQFNIISVDNDRQAIYYLLNFIDHKLRLAQVCDGGDQEEQDKRHEERRDLFQRFQEYLNSDNFESGMYSRIKKFMELSDIEYTHQSSEYHIHSHVEDGQSAIYAIPIIKDNKFLIMYCNTASKSGSFYREERDTKNIFLPVL